MFAHQAPFEASLVRQVLLPRVVQALVSGITLQLSVKK
jgi:hypothetical protein